jgi:hypothetical protein
VIFDLNPSQKSMLYQNWMSVVAQYSCTTLTNPLDRLIALSGIAKSFSPLVQDTYVAGMWRGNLELDLGWYNVQRTDVVYISPDVYCAPSWSWASNNGQITYLDQTTKLSHVVDGVLRHATNDTTGRVASGWLDLRGQLKPTLPSWTLKSRNCPWEVAGEPRHDIIPDMPTFVHHQFGNDNTDKRLFYMPIANEITTSHIPVCQALLLRIVDGQLGVFERIGMAHELRRYPAWLESDFPESDRRYQMLDELDEEVKQSLPCLEYRDGLHTIRII